MLAAGGGSPAPAAHGGGPPGQRYLSPCDRVFPAVEAPGGTASSYGDVRAALAARYLVGNGIEIGALHSPLTLPADTDVKYVDRLPVSELPAPVSDARQLGAGRGRRRRRWRGSVDVRRRLARLRRRISLPGALEDPIATIEHHLDKLVPGGVLFYVVPDKRFTFDVNRPVTALEHMIADYEHGPEGSRRDHVEEAARLTWSESACSEQDVRDTIEAIETSGESIHMHVWTQAEFLGLLLHCRARFDDAFDIEVCQRHLIEAIAGASQDRRPASGRPPTVRRSRARRSETAFPRHNSRRCISSCWSSIACGASWITPLTAKLRPSRSTAASTRS